VEGLKLSFADVSYILGDFTPLPCYDFG